MRAVLHTSASSLLRAVPRCIRGNYRTPAPSTPRGKAYTLVRSRPPTPLLTWRATRAPRETWEDAAWEGRLKSIEEGNLRCLQPSACLVEIEPFDAVDLGECLDGA